MIQADHDFMTAPQLPIISPATLLNYDELAINEIVGSTLPRNLHKTSIKAQHY